LQRVGFALIGHDGGCRRAPESKTRMTSAFTRVFDALCAGMTTERLTQFERKSRQEFRGGKLVVTRTRDGGKSFDILSTGLPQSHAYDIVYRHALALDETGEWLAFGSATGGLWVSEDQGESWTCLSHTLPPIYAVRFA
jgi:hypothetical protein